MDLFWIILGIVAVVLMMVFIINPPEAWIKRFFQQKPNDRAK